MASTDQFDGTRIIDRGTIRNISDIGAVIDAVESAFRSYENGDAIMPPKSYVDLDDVDGDFRSMPAKVGDSAGVKWVNVHPENPERFGLPTVMGLVVYSDPESAYPLAVLDGTELTRLRTGAAAGVATRHLASPDVETLGLLGAGEQARTQLAAINHVRDVREVVVSDLDEAALEAFVDHATARGFDVRTGTPEEVASCDVVSTTTPSREPLIHAEDVSAGTHINAIGADAAGKQELDPDILLDGAVIIDDWEQCAHSGEINVPVDDGLLSRDGITAEIGEVVSEPTSELRGRTTVFDSTGLAIQDIATARQLFDSAAEREAGTLIDIVDTP